MPRTYRMDGRRPAIDRTTASILAATRDLLAAGGQLSMPAVARRAGVSRSTVYNRFPDRTALLAALVPPAFPAPGEHADADPRRALGKELHRTAGAWAAGPALYRHLHVDTPALDARTLAERLAAADALRPGCSLKEAEDVIAALGSFPLFDRLHRDGRRTPAAVADILTRLAAAILA